MQFSSLGDALLFNNPTKKKRGQDASVCAGVLAGVRVGVHAARGRAYGCVRARVQACARACAQERARNQVDASRKCSTSFPGGYQVDGLPPASHERKCLEKNSKKLVLVRSQRQRLVLSGDSGKSKLQARACICQHQTTEAAPEKNTEK